MAVTLPTPFKLSTDDIKRLNDTLELITYTEQQMSKAARAGVDVTVLQEKLAKSKIQTLGLLREYGVK